MDGTKGNDRIRKMDDLISRQQAIDEVMALPNCENGYSDTYDKGRFISLLEELPPVGKRGEWIPVSERLPQYGNYLVSYGTDEEIDIGTYDQKTGLWSACDADGMYYVASKGLEVIAWMPLPKPYEVKE